MKKLTALFLTAALLLALCVGCGADSAAPETSAVSDFGSAAVETSEKATHGNPVAPAVSVEEAAVEETASSAETLPEQVQLTYPLVTDGSECVTVWVSLPPHVSPYMEDVAESACYRAAVEATGIKMEATTISTAVQDEQFQLMCASGTTGDYDMIVGASIAYGSADAAIEDGILLDLTEYLEPYMPDYYRFLQHDEEIRKVLTTDSGAIADIAGPCDRRTAAGFGTGRIGW